MTVDRVQRDDTPLGARLNRQSARLYIYIYYSLLLRSSYYYSPYSRRRYDLGRVPPTPVLVFSSLSI